MALRDNAVYVDGKRTADPNSLDETFECMRDRRGMAWIGLYRPDKAEILAVAKEFDLHPLAVEDAVTAHQRPKLERYDNVLFTVLRPARYLDDVEQVEFGEVHVFTGRDFVVTIRQAESPDLGRCGTASRARPSCCASARRRCCTRSSTRSSTSTCRSSRGCENDIDEIEDQLFKGDPAVSRRIYELSREVIEFQRATHPLLDMLDALERGFDKYDVDVELRRNLRDVKDHAIRVVERADSFRALLQNALTVQATLVGQQQNEEMQAMTEMSIAQNEEVKKISAWAAIFFAPTFVASVYGMNFHDMPELSWKYGYPFALALMVLLASGCTACSNAAAGCELGLRALVDDAAHLAHRPLHAVGGDDVDATLTPIVFLIAARERGPAAPRRSRRAGAATPRGRSARRGGRLRVSTHWKCGASAGMRRMSSSIWVGNRFTPRRMIMSSVRPVIFSIRRIVRAVPGSSRVRSRVR